MIQTLIAAILLLSTQAPPEPSVTTLDNGLTVIVQEIGYAPVVASVIAYRVGSRNESDGLRGVSHFCEHMMFRGTDSMPGSRLWQIIQRDGGWANAFTSNDMTLYFEVLPSSRLIDALLIESDRMTGSRFDSADVVAERNVVLDELRMGSMDDPSGALFEALDAAAFTVHPYGHPVIGCEGDVASFDSAAAKAYHSAFYTPGNAVLAIAGDVETADVLRMVDSLFGGIPAGPTPPPLDSFEPGQTEPRFVEMDHPSTMARVALGFHVPSASSGDAAELDLIATLLSGGRASWLETALVQEGIASEAWAMNGGGIDPGLFYVGATLMPGVGFDEAEAVIWSLLDSLGNVPLPGEELRSLANRARAGAVMEESSPVGRAISLAYNAAAYGDPAFGDRRLEETMDVTPADIMEVSARWFRPGNSTTARLTPTGSGPGAERERAALPVDIEAPSEISYEGLDIPSSMLVSTGRSVSDGVEVSELPNGLVLMTSEDHTFPLVSLGFAIPMGSRMAPVEKAGIAEMTAAAMLYGTDELDYASFHGRLEDEGTSLGMRTMGEYTYGSSTMLTEDLPLVVESAAGILIRPALRDGDIDQCRDEQLAYVRERSESAFSVAREQLSRMLLEDPAEARIVTGQTTLAVSNDDVRDFWRICSRPSGAVMAIAGDVTHEEALALVETWFGGWTSPGEDLPPVVTPALSQAPGDTAVTSMPGRVQAAVFTGVPGPTLESPMYEAFSTMNSILGSGIGSRLGHSVRDEQGLAYSVGSRNSATMDTGYFSAFFSTRADYAPQALSSVIVECSRMAVEEVSPVELQLQQAMTVGENALSGMTYGGRVSTLVANAARGLPADYDRVSEERVLGLTAQDLLEAAEFYLGSGRWFVSVAGGLDEDMEPLAN